MKKTIEKMNKTKTWLFEKINKTDKLLAQTLQEKNREGSNQEFSLFQIKKDKLQWIPQKYKGS